MAKHALCIGVNNYPGTHMDLAGCVNDAEDWTAELKARGFAVTQLLDAQATKAAMVKGFKAVIGAAAKGDIVVITFAGHGTYVPDLNGDELDGLDEALCPYDLQTGGAALIDDEIHAMFAARKPGVRLVLISDSCHSGTVTRAAGADPDARRLAASALHADGQLAAAGSAAARRERQAGGSRAVTSGASPFVSALSRGEGDLLLGGLQGGAQQLQLRRQDQGAPERRVHLLRAQGPEDTPRQRHLCRLACRHQPRFPAVGEVSRKVRRSSAAQRRASRRSSREARR